MKNHLLVLLSALFICSSSSAQAITNEHFKKVVWIVFENTDYASAIAQDNFKQIADNGVLFTNLTAEAHPSQGNYIAMIAGSKLNVKNDSVINLKESHIGDLLEKAHLKWKIYAENYPGKCFTGKSSGKYVRKHVPFMSFLNVTQDSSRCLNIEDESNFLSDYNKGTLAEFSMYIPNIENDGHDTGVDFSGKWLFKKFGLLLNAPQKLGDTLFIITFDESETSSPNNKIYTVIVGSKIAKGTQNSQAINHTALLKMIEDEYGIGNLGRDDSKAPVIKGIWK
jgi:hypothetical protein